MGIEHGTFRLGVVHPHHETIPLPPRVLFLRRPNDPIHILSKCSFWSWCSAEIITARLKLVREEQEARRRTAGEAEKSKQEASSAPTYPGPMGRDGNTDSDRAGKPHAAAAFVSLFTVCFRLSLSSSLQILIILLIPGTVLSILFQLLTS